MASKNKRQRLVFSEKLMYSFINDYKQSRCLWDTKNPDYKCAEKRRSAVSKLASRYDITEEEVKKKINSLRSTFLQEKKKVEESKKLGNDEVYEPSLYWYHELEFLYEFIIPRKGQHACTFNSSSTHTAPLQHSECHVIQRDQSPEDINQEVDQEHLIFEFVPDGNEKTIFTQKLEPSSYVAQPQGARKIKRQSIKKSPSHPQYSEHVELPPSRLPNSERVPSSPQPSPHLKNQDEFDTFCCSIASQLRTLPPADAIEMQLEIQQLVSRRRLVVLKNQQNLSLFRTWENSDGYHQYQSHNPPMENGNAQAERAEKLVLEQ